MCHAHASKTATVRLAFDKTNFREQEIISKATDAIVSVEGEGLHPVTWVLIEDVASGEWGVGGQPVTTDALREINQASA
jgi:4-oxalocrotonate tautomerase